MDILIHRYGKDGRFIESFYSHSDVDVKLEELKPPKWCVFGKLSPLPKVDDLHVPVMVDGAWVVKAKAFYERPDYNYDWDEATETWIKQEPLPEPEPSILDPDNLIKLLVALKDKAELGTAIPLEIAELVEAEKVKIVAVDEPVIKEIVSK